MTDSLPHTRLRRTVVLTFPLAFAAHDLEGVLTAAAWSGQAAHRVAKRHPLVPSPPSTVLPSSRKEIAVAVGVVATAVAGVTAVSLRSIDGELRLFQAALAAFSAHSLSHIGATIVFRGYTPGVATVPLVIVPYSLWAWPRLRRAGLVRTPAEAVRAARTGVALALPVTLLGHVLARALTRARVDLGFRWTLLTSPEPGPRLKRAAWPRADSTISLDRSPRTAGR